MPCGTAGFCSYIAGLDGEAAGSDTWGPAQRQLLGLIDRFKDRDLRPRGET